jgi:hypothetical protein
MPSTTLKHAAATVGVLAGLLAAAGPASAQILDGPVLAKAGPKPSVVVIDLNDPFFRLAVKAPSIESVWHEAARNGVVTNNNDPDTMASAGISSEVEPVELVEAQARGTQVGSEGVKGKGRGFLDIPAELEGDIPGRESSMLSTTLTRAAATVGVLAGLLATATPADAQLWEGTSLRPQTPSVSGAEMSAALRSANAPAGPTSQVFTSVSNATGTQTGSEGIKPPEIHDHGITQADDRPLEDVSFLTGFSRGGHLAYTSLDAKSAKDGLYPKQTVLDAHMEI